jgi:hypothetical protein
MASEIYKKFKKEVRKTGTPRFVLAVSLVSAGLIWKFFQLGGDSAEGAVRKLISFWPIFWITWMAAGFIAWAFSGFKNMSALIFSLTGGAFMAETVLPGVVFNTENWPLLMVLAGVLLFALPKRNLQANAYGDSYGVYGGKRSSHKTGGIKSSNNHGRFKSGKRRTRSSSSNNSSKEQHNESSE